MFHEELVALTQAKIDAGALPASGDVTTLGGSSAGTVCAACDRPIALDATELEIEWSRDGRVANASLHPACYAAWSAAVEKMRD